jgi:GABA(A) receptor-associated protein
MHTVDEYRKATPTKDREEEAARIRARYPDRIPVVAYRAARSTALPHMDRNKFLTPSTMTMGEMVFVLRKRMKLDPAIAVFVFCGDTGILAPTSACMSDLYARHKHHDGFLYLTYCAENTFG